jgi:hypothetical protein
MMHVKITDTVNHDGKMTYFEYELDTDSHYTPDVLDDLVSRVVKMASLDRAIRSSEPTGEDLE